MSATALPRSVRRFRELFLSAACAAAVRAAARLGLADAIGDEAEPVSTVADRLGVDTGALRRLLRALASNGIFAEAPDDGFVHTDMSKLLREDAPRSLKYSALWATEPWTWTLWPHLDEAVRTGEPVFEDLHGKDFFGYLHAEAPESAEIFDRAMTQSSRLSAIAIADELDLSGAEVVADIAGGQGHVLATLLERHPGLRGVLFDLPEVVANADPRLVGEGPLASRTALVPGDCRHGVAADADVYVLKNILEWDDESTIATLRGIAEGRPGARVFVLENLLDGSPELKFTTAMDLLLLLNVGGRKHTRDGLADLVRRSGLRLDEVRPVNSYLHLFTCTVPE
ncbi:methyltransferase [Amycolatopsis orientalis]|uniref:methyltransferase n=1 Tax=Amycolatopsis orientalis TaxID=31958 RepID=UPI000401BADD|nr:methyltransferase [Amycolatopsis orientalis]